VARSRPYVGALARSRGRGGVSDGAWILSDERPLSPELETFLETGEPPVYFGFGSMRAPHDLGQVMIQTARALGRRAIVSRGWADLSLVDDEPDCLAIGEVNQQALFTRVAAVVHHGGAGTTTAAALAGAPQVVIPRSTTSTTGHNEYITSASEPRTHPARQPPTR
jgi:vancomycin aglycone glucosyltransferase